VTNGVVQQLSLLAPQLVRPGPPAWQLGAISGPPSLAEPDEDPELLEPLEPELPPEDDDPLEDDDVELPFVPEPTGPRSLLESPQPATRVHAMKVARTAAASTTPMLSFAFFKRPQAGGTRCAPGSEATAATCLRATVAAVVRATRGRVVQRE
jgi:hypothetical protein